MKNIFLFAKRAKELQMADAEAVAKALKNFGCTLYTDISGIKDAEFVENPKSLINDIDLLIVLGGDGSLLGVARTFAPFKKPILGINMGRLGYMVELEKSDLKDLERLFNKDYTIEKRMMLSASVYRDNKEVFSGIALNDVVVAKGALSRMVHLEISADNNLVNSYHADGVVVATPTGSTAYSMSAGGSVVAPSIEAILLTPICPHALTLKPIILPDNQVVSISATFPENEEVMLTLDGQEGFALTPSDVIKITKSTHTSDFIRLKNRNFFHILQQKLKENR